MSSSVSPYFSESSLTKLAANKFPNPFFDIASEYIPIEIVNILEWCIPPGADVDVDAYGHTVKIEDIMVGFSVLTASATTDLVDKVSVRQVDEDIVRIKSDCILWQEKPENT